MSAEKRIQELGITIPQAATPVGSYVPGVLVGNILFMSGHGPFDSKGQVTSQGKVGRNMSIEEANAVARQVALNMLGSVRQIAGSLDRVKRVVKVLGLVNCVDGFTASPKVIDGFSNCMVEIFGDAGRHARSAFGVMELPAGIPVEVEAIFELHQD
jgi:enamine deaminase RidA (YjgF/YER057c/UK114 family)